MLRRYLSLMALLLALGLFATACNGDDGGTDDGGDTATDETTDTTGTDDAADDTADDADDTDAGDDAAATDGESVRVGMVYDIGGRGDLSFNDAAAAGLDRAIDEFGIEANELEPAEGGENREELLRLLSQQDFDLVFGVGFLFEESIASAAGDFPEVRYGLIDGFLEDLDADSNVVSLSFAEEQGSFLVGAAAALKSETGRIGFIGGVEIDLIRKFEAGFVAGAQEVNPDIEIDIRYISQPPDFAGFNDPARGREIALGIYEGGADIIYHAAGGSGGGLFEAAREVSEGGDSKVWAIGVDSDQYQTAPAELQEYILTSMLKQVDVAVYETIAAQVNGEFEGGYREFDLETGGVDYSTSGGFVDDIADQLEELKQRVIDGEIEVPTAP
jgi:basic membrane protein A and related proteins